MRRLLLSAALLGAAAAATAQPAAAPADSASPAGAATPATPAAPTTEAMPYMTMAGESDLFEINSGQIAQSKSQDRKVKAFAAMLIKHHTQTTATLMKQAKAAGLTPPPPALTAPKQAMIDQLNSAAPGEFDQLFLSQQVPAHQEALALHSTYAQGGDTPQLKMAAKSAIPIVQRHLKEAQALMSKGR